MNYSYKVIKNNKTIERYETHSKRKFYNKVRSIKWSDMHSSVYLRVNYGMHLSNRNKIESFWNDGDYYNQKDLWQALEAFTK